MVCLILHTVIIISRKNWRITIKLHSENLRIFFFKKRTYTHARTPLLLLVFAHFSMTPPFLPSSMNVFFEWPQMDLIIYLPLRGILLLNLAGFWLVKLTQLLLRECHFPISYLMPVKSELQEKKKWWMGKTFHGK